MQEKFESWGVVELFGHQQIAGRISESTVGGCSFVRVDVPNADQSESAVSPWAYTRYFGQGAIYALNPTSEQVARSRAKQCQEPPFAYEVNREAVERAVDERMKRLTNTTSTQHSQRGSDMLFSSQDDSDDDLDDTDGGSED